MPPKTKITLYFPEAELDEMRAEAARQDRSLSWLAQASWNIAKETLRGTPGPPTHLIEKGAGSCPHQQGPLRSWTVQQRETLKRLFGDDWQEHAIVIDRIALNSVLSAKEAFESYTRSKLAHRGGR